MKRVVPNPYTNRAAVLARDQFFGREDELSDIFTRIHGGQSVLLMGDRRIGKSSLLRAVGFERDDALEDKSHFVLIDLQSLAGCTEDTCIRVFVKEIEAATGVRTEELGRAALEGVAEGVRDSGYRMILAMDEFDVLVWNEQISPEFLANLRSWTARYRFPLVLAFREGSIDRIVEDEKFGSAFLNLFGTVYVGPFKETEAQELVRRPALDQGITFSDEEVDLVLDLAGYFPLFIQIACYHLFELKKTSSSNVDIEGTVEREFLFEAAPHMEYMWQRLTEPERQAVLDWSRLGGTHDSEAQQQLLRRGVLIEERRALRLYSRVVPGLINKWQAPQRSISQSVKDALWK